MYALSTMPPCTDPRGQACSPIKLSTRGGQTSKFSSGGARPETGSQMRRIRRSFEADGKVFFHLISAVSSLFLVLLFSFFTTSQSDSIRCAVLISSTCTLR